MCCSLGTLRLNLESEFRMVRGQPLKPRDFSGIARVSNPAGTGSCPATGGPKFSGSMP